MDDEVLFTLPLLWLPRSSNAAGCIPKEDGRSASYSANNLHDDTALLLPPDWPDNPNSFVALMSYHLADVSHLLLTILRTLK